MKYLNIFEIFKLKKVPKEVKNFQNGVSSLLWP